MGAATAVGPSAVVRWTAVLIPIDHPDDPRIEPFLGLRDQETRKQRERADGDMASVFMAEGDLVIDRAITHGYSLRSVLIAGRRTKPLPEAVGDADVYLASDSVLTEVTGRPELRDPIACFSRPPLPELGELLEQHSTFAVLENVNNPNNLGVIMRNAAALGIGAVLLDPQCADPLYRRAVRASMGQVFAIPHTRLAPLPNGLDAVHAAGVTTVALTPNGDVALRDFSAPRKAAVLLGAEGPGLTEPTMAAAQHRVRIPMANGVDSLNVANAAAIAFHHLQTA